MKFAVIFDMAVRHSYYADGACPDFVIEPRASTARLLRNYRCVVKPRKGGLQVAAELGADGSPVIAADGAAKFRFNMRLTNSDFALFTDLSSINKQPAPLFVPAGADASKGGSLTLATQNLAPEGTVFAAFEFPGSIFTAPGSWPVQFTLDFQPKCARWMYYCVTDMKLTGKDLRLIDAGTTASPLVFSPGNRTDLSQSPDTADTVATQLAGRYPDLARVRFVSDDVVACQESPRKLSLQLDGHNFPDLLPAPPIRNCSVWPAAVQGNQPQQDALFQVVKYVSYSFSKNGV